LLVGYEGVAESHSPSGVQDTEFETQDFLEHCFREYRERSIGPWGMRLKETGAIAGSCGLPHIDFKNR